MQRVRSTSVLLALLAVWLSILVSPTEPCSCQLRHPQTHVCEADFVVTARIRRETKTPDGSTAYKVRIKRFLKVSEKGRLALSKGLIYTLPGTCKVSLLPRRTHVVTGSLAGGKPWTSICHFAKPWRDLAPKMKKGFRLLYETGCDCPIMSCHWWNSCPKAPFYCSWETSTETEDCQAQHGVCLRRPSGKCDWIGGRLYRTCMKKRRGWVPGNASDYNSNETPQQEGNRLSTNHRPNPHTMYEREKNYITVK